MPNDTKIELQWLCCLKRKILKRWGRLAAFERKAVHKLFKHHKVSLQK